MSKKFRKPKSQIQPPTICVGRNPGPGRIRDEMTWEQTRRRIQKMFRNK